MPAVKNLYLYLHTHWDREWYLTHEEYRTQLTFAAADILNKLKTGTLPSFLLDGQSCIIEDLEEVVPELCDEIRQLMAEKRLDAGPWYVLADQMLVSGESLLRNLEMGLAVTTKYGKPAMLGYCPDTFGHTQDMPRILNQFDIKSAFVWRGVPARTQPLFWWQSTDGSRVLTYHMFRGYYQTAFHDHLTTEKLAEFLLSWGEISSDFNAFLMPVGGDHLSAPNNFIRQLDSARLLLKIESMGKFVDQPNAQVNVQSCALSEFADLMLDYSKSKQDQKEQIDVVAGELRDNAAALAYERAYMLAGVLSTRMYLKLQNRLAEKRLSRVLEPVFTLLNAQKIFAYPHSQLNFAWRTLMRNHPHDSMCGCSVDAVHREMVARFEKVQEILNVLDRKAFESMAIDKSSDVDNLFDALANQTIPTDKTADAAKKQTHLCNVNYKLNDSEQAAEEPQLQALAVLGPTALPDPKFAASQLLIANLSGEPGIGPIPLSWAQEITEPQIASSTLYQNQHLTIQVVGSREENHIFTGTNQIPETKKVRIYDGYLQTAELPAFGFSSLPWTQSLNVASVLPIGGLSLNDDDVKLTEKSISNEFFAIEIDTAGDIIVSNKKAADKNVKLGHHLRDVGDGGDSYNFDPLEGDQPILANFVSVAAGKSGPLVASLLLTYEMNIPQGVVEVEQPDGKTKRMRSAKCVAQTFTTEITLKKSVPILFFETSWNNQARNHRLEVLLDTGSVVTKSFSENHFSLVEREHNGINSESVQLPVLPGTEAPLDRYPCQRFFIANGQVFFNNGLPEYGVDGSQVSLTILRAISELSRADLRSRGGGAGPPVLTDEANCLGANKVGYAWAPLTNASFGGRLESQHQSGEMPEPDEHVQAQAVLEHLAQSASGSPQQTQSTHIRKAGSPFGAIANQRHWSECEHNVVNAYRLCEIFEGLHWHCFTKDVPVSLKSQVASDNAAIRVIALRTLAQSSEIEIRLLNVLSTSQIGVIAIQFAHNEAKLAYADGRLIATLQLEDGSEKVVANSENAPIIKGKSKKKTPNNLANIASYKVEMGANALVSLRLQYNKG